MRWYWRRCHRLPNRSCSTTGWSASGATIPTPRSRCCSYRPTTRRPVCLRNWSPSWRRTRIGPSCRFGCSGFPAACRRARRWFPSCPAGTPTGPRRSCSAAFCARTRREPGSSPVSPRRCRNFVSNGPTPPSLKTPGNSRDSSSGARSWRSNGSSFVCSGRSTNPNGSSNPSCWRRRVSMRVSSGFRAQPWRRPGRCSMNSPPDGAGSRST